MTYFRYGFASDVGLKRHQNQDSGVACPELGLFVLADGMGGHMGGETASAIAVKTIPEVILSSQDKRANQEPHQEPKKMLGDSFQAANQAIYDAALKDSALQGMGTTTTALFFAKHHTLIIANVGDSRCYYFRPNAIWQLTKDHSLVQDKLRAGLITREQVKTDRMKNVITRSVGFEREVLVDLYEMTFQVGDVFMLCSDGLCGQVDDDEIMAIVEKCLFKEGDIEKATKLLIQSANDRGGEDNTTVILVQVLP